MLKWFSIDEDLVSKVNEDWKVNKVNRVPFVFQNSPDNFSGGKVNNFVDAWKAKFNGDWLINHIFGVRVNITGNNEVKDKREITFFALWKRYYGKRSP